VDIFKENSSEIRREGEEERRRRRKRKRREREEGRKGERKERREGGRNEGRNYLDKGEYCQDSKWRHLCQPFQKLLKLRGCEEIFIHWLPDTKAHASLPSIWTETYSLAFLLPGISVFPLLMYVCLRRLMLFV
jgi:hypothetical protein